MLVLKCAEVIWVLSGNDQGSTWPNGIGADVFSWAHLHVIVCDVGLILTADLYIFCPHK